MTSLKQKINPFIYFVWNTCTCTMKCTTNGNKWDVSYNVASPTKSFIDESLTITKQNIEARLVVVTVFYNPSTAIVIHRQDLGFKTQDT